MKGQTIQGKIQGNERGYAFLIPLEEGVEDYFISHSDLRGAMHGDIVLATTTSGEGPRTTARVLKILERGITELVGTFFATKTSGFVVPDERKYFNDIHIEFGKGVRAKSGDKVVCKILSYPKGKSPEGLITKILGRQFEKNAELKSILFNYKLPQDFSKEVKDYAKQVATPINEKELVGREDYRNLLTMTIDGEDAKDFDDAISIEKISGGYRLYVHIADVSHYVRSGSPIDAEAFNRATSVYFPESVIPMLPESLCNDMCSLVEGEDRLTLSCVMDIDYNGRVNNYKIAPSVIKSSARMTYTAVQKIIDGESEYINKYSHLVENINLMNELADILIERRDLEGSIDLDVKESAISVDKSGEIIVSSAKRDKAHRLIEEFMILANVTVAEYMYYLEKPFIYRIHEKPTEERLENFYDFLSGLGVKVRRKKDQIYSKDFQTVLKNADNTPLFTLINRVMLRSMQKAKYSPEEKGHFGLSKDHYCHFTSPIRRYPDLVVHRIIKDFFNGVNVEKKYGEFVFTASKQSSERERIAIDAERAVDEYYKMLYISGYVGEEFEGVISGVTTFGIFVELENAIEGLVKIDTIKFRKAKLQFNEKSFTLTDGVKTYRLGQRVRIKVAGINLGERRAEFTLCK